MGFWHTGYMEFHEPVGLGDLRFELAPPTFPCAHCNEIFLSSDELRRHRFESHPLHRPILLVQGQELSTHPIRITQGLTEDEVRATGCDQAFLNGEKVSVCSVPQKLAQISSGVCRLVLSKADVSATFVLDFRLASEDDLKGVETQFERMALGHQLDIRAIEEFISATSGFETAIGYCDGICSYLYGVLAKENSPESSLPRKAYVGKFNRSATELADYNRPLAQMIGSLIEFHFNHFEEAARLAGEARVGQAAARYAAWLQDREIRTRHVTNSDFAGIDLEALVTDWSTEEIIRWTVRPLNELSGHVTEMESLLNREIEEFDRVKVHVLLGEFCAAIGDTGNKLRHAKALRNLPALESWAESMIHPHPKDQ